MTHQNSLALMRVLVGKWLKDRVFEASDA